MRSRSVVPHTILRDTRLRRLSPLARRVWLCLWFAVSDVGTFERDADLVAAALDWYSPPPAAADVDQALDELVKMRLFRPFRARGRRWIWHADFYAANSGEWVAKNDHAPPPPWLTLERDEHGHYRAKPVSPKGSGDSIDASMTRQRRVNDASLTRALIPSPALAPAPAPAPAPGTSGRRAPSRGSSHDPPERPDREIPPEIRELIERHRIGLAPKPSEEATAHE
jgi:hypothetical protein